jgi:hypothetical protein
MAQNTFNPINILDTTDATGIGSGGSLTIGGGASIGKDFYVGGNISISGTTTSFSDNIVLINKNPTNSCDTGLLFQRFTNDISNDQNYSGILYSEISDEFHFGYVSSDINRSNATIDSFVRIKTNGINSTGSSNTLGNIFTTGGSVGIGTTSPATDNGSRLSIVGSAFDSSGILRLYPSTFGQRAVIGFHSGQTSGSHWTLGRQNASNEFALSLSTNTAGMYFFANGNVSCGPLTTTAVTTGMILATTSISSGALYATNSTVTNFVATSITTGTLKATSAQFTTLTAGSIRTSDISLNGNLVATGDITAFGSLSDRRLKTNIVDIGSESALNIVRSLRPVTFDWKSDIFNESKRGSCDVGFIAQEVEEIIPQAVAEYQEMNSGTFYKNIRHERLIPYLVGAIQKLENINKKLEQFIHLKFPNEYN